jgi:hypothetical protein
MSRFAMPVALGALLTARGGGGPSDSEFVAACMNEGQGAREEASSITSKMSESEQQAALEVIGKMLEQCAGGAK